MNAPELDSLQTLQSKIQRLEIRNKTVLAANGLILLVFFLGAWQVVDRKADRIIAHTITLVDNNGVARVILGAPVPGPVVDGKEGVRRAAATGIIFNDATGNERGGMAMLDDGGMNLCIDNAGTERNCFFFMPKMGNGAAFMDGKGENRAMLYLDTSGAPHLILRDEQGRALVSLPEQPKP